jgi:hypothetical protein
MKAPMPGFVSDAKGVVAGVTKSESKFTGFSFKPLKCNCFLKPFFQVNALTTGQIQGSPRVVFTETRGSDYPENVIQLTACLQVPANQIPLVVYTSKGGNQ